MLRTGTALGHRPGRPDTCGADGVPVGGVAADAPVRRRGAHPGGVALFGVNWLYTVLLLVISAGTVGFAGFLLRRLFTVEPGVPGSDGDAS